MSLAIDGFWKSGFWSQTFWANGFWFEGASVIPPPTIIPDAGGSGREKNKAKALEARRKEYYANLGIIKQEIKTVAKAIDKVAEKLPLKLSQEAITGAQKQALRREIKALGLMYQDAYLEALKHDLLYKQQLQDLANYRQKEEIRRFNLLQETQLTARQEEEEVIFMMGMFFMASETIQ